MSLTSRRRLCIAISSLLIPLRAAVAQSRAPTFFTTSAVTGAVVDARSASVLKRSVALDLDNATLPEALSTIERATGVRLVYAQDLLPPAMRVSIEAKRITLLAALSDVLQDAGVDIEVTSDATLTLVRHGTVSTRRSDPRPRPDGVTVSGRVTDNVTGAPVARVVVHLDRTALGALTDGDGRYAIQNVPAGQYQITFRRIGYVARSASVVVADRPATVDVTLSAVPTKLDEVVTTAVGDQRRYEVGTVIATIKADSIAPTAPITSLTDLMSARAPGVQIIESSGITGSGEAIRIRGLTSLVLQNDPILIVDGVREDNSAGSDLTAVLGFGGEHPTPTRLNDIDFNDIESIDVLKGPAASTEYGTDAANGVIVIRTKRGAVGHPRWSLSGEQTWSDMPATFPELYYSWGHTTDASHTPVQCPLLSNAYGGYSSTSGTCAVDSVTHWMPLNHPNYSLFGTGERQKYGLQLSGGSDAVRYFVAGGLSNETGLTQLPPVLERQAEAENLSLPHSAITPNQYDQRSIRFNTAIALSPIADLSANGAYLSDYQTTPSVDELLQGVVQGTPIADSAHYYGYGAYSGFYNPLQSMREYGTQNSQRLTGGITSGWRPFGWLATHATVGVDHGSSQSQAINSPGGVLSPYQFFTPGIAVSNGITDVYSADLRGTAQLGLTRGVRSVTSAGLQMVDTRVSGQASQATGISATNQTLNGAAAPTVSQIANRQATLGGYVEEQIGFADRLFLTGAVRIDAGSGFGTRYGTAVYPKGSASWLVSGTGPTTLRLRAAFGESGVQPANGAASLLFAPTVVWANGGAVPGNAINWPGNANLRPERSAELEGGTDIGFWNSRFTLELTGYTKTTNDALVNQSLGWDLSQYTYQYNVGTVHNYGAEATLSATLIDARPLVWSITVNGSINHNTLVHLAPGIPAQLVTADYTQVRQAAGFPLYGLWGQKIHYSDRNRDGIIETNEVAVDDSASYIGPSLPTQEASFSTSLGFWHRALSVSALLDYRGGYRLANSTAYLEALIPQSQREQNDRHAPLALQAQSAAVDIISCCTMPAPFIEDGTFLRFRELSLTYTLPASWTRVFRTRRVSLTGAVRNLALWTRYSGADPEVTNARGDAVQASPVTGARSLNNDVRVDDSTVPLARYWVLRLNLEL